MSFASMSQYYNGSWIHENAQSQGYAHANLIVAALQQKTALKEYKLTHSSGKIYAENGLILEKNGVTIPIPSARAVYIIGHDLSAGGESAAQIKSKVDKLLGTK